MQDKCTTFLILQYFVKAAKQVFDGEAHFKDRLKKEKLQNTRKGSSEYHLVLGQNNNWIAESMASPVTPKGGVLTPVGPHLSTANHACKWILVP